MLGTMHALAPVMRSLTVLLGFALLALAASTSHADELAPTPEVTQGAPLRASLPAAEAAAPPPETELYSPGMVAGGAILSGLGAVGAVVGTSVIVDSATRESSRNPTAGLAVVFGGVFLGGGVLLLGGGIPVIVVGAQQVPVEGAAVVPSAHASLRLGAGSLSLSGAF